MNTRRTPAPPTAADLVACDLLCLPVAITTADVAGWISDSPAARQHPLLWVVVEGVSWLPVSWLLCSVVGLAYLIARREFAAALWATVPILHLVAATAFASACCWCDWL